ncbi:MAG: hypothetical protein IJN07_03535 [Clostridia bacterium]|nr:hypothetical protein [Clostridia bacterium]
MRRKGRKLWIFLVSLLIAAVMLGTVAWVALGRRRDLENQPYAPGDTEPRVTTTTIDDGTGTTGTGGTTDTTDTTGNAKATTKKKTDKKTAKPTTKATTKATTRTTGTRATNSKFDNNVGWGELRP